MSDSPAVALNMDSGRAVWGVARNSAFLISFQGGHQCCCRGSPPRSQRIEEEQTVLGRQVSLFKGEDVARLSMLSKLAVITSLPGVCEGLAGAGSFQQWSPLHMGGDIRSVSALARLLVGRAAFS